MGLRWAREGEWRVVAYAEGGYAVNRWVEGPDWVIDHDIPSEVERPLCEALGIEIK
jgi:hypothetical protein